VGDDCVVPALIDDILAGKAVELALRGVAGAWRAFRDEPDSLGRLLVLLHADFGAECDLQRDVFYAWRSHDELRGALEQVLAGQLLPGPAALAAVGDLLEDRLVRTGSDARPQLAARIACAAFAAAPIVVEGGGEDTRLLIAHIDAVGASTTARRVPALPLFSVPVNTPAFVGRERALEHLAAGLSNDGAVAVTQVDAIHGLGGVGKTQLAARYARTRRDAYDVIWWLRAEQPATLYADLAALAIALGLVDIDIARTLGNLGGIQRQLGEFEAARETFSRVLAIFAAVYGLEHPEVARTLGNLGAVQQQLGELDVARVTQQRALAINEAVYGPEHPEVARALGNLGIVERELGELEEARLTFARVLAIFEAVYGPQHPDVARALGNLGIAQQQLGALDEAYVTQQRALAINQMVYGPEHPEVALTLVNLGNVRQQLGDLDPARECTQRAIGIFDRSLGSDHPYAARARALLARLDQ
jgi:tetratricopeptide (TPR) repeat protein